MAAPGPFLHLADVHVPAANLGGLEAVHVAQRAQFLYGGGNGGLVDIPEIFMFF